MPVLSDPGQWHAGSSVSDDTLGAEPNAGAEHGDTEKTDDDFEE